MHRVDLWELGGPLGGGCRVERLAGARGKVEQCWISLAWISPDDGVEPHFSSPRQEVGRRGGQQWPGRLGGPSGHTGTLVLISDMWGS